MTLLSVVTSKIPLLTGNAVLVWSTTEEDTAKWSMAPCAVFATSGFNCVLLPSKRSEIHSRLHIQQRKMLV